MAMKSLHKYTVQEARNRTYDVFTVTPTLDATETAYGAADVLFNPTIVTGLFNDKDDVCMIKNIFVIDADDQGAAFELYFTTSSTVFGTLNATANIADNTAILGGVAITSFDADGDFDLFRVSQTSGIDLVIKANEVDKNVYIGGIAAATPTYGTTGTPLTIKIGVQYL